MKLGSAMSRKSFAFGLLLSFCISAEAKEGSIRERFLRLGASLSRGLSGTSSCSAEYSAFLEARCSSVIVVLRLCARMVVSPTSVSTSTVYCFEFGSL